MMRSDPMIRAAVQNHRLHTCKQMRQKKSSTLSYLCCTFSFLLKRMCERVGISLQMRCIFFSDIARKRLSVRCMVEQDKEEEEQNKYDLLITIASSAENFDRLFFEYQASSNCSFKALNSFSDISIKRRHPGLTSVLKVFDADDTVLIIHDYFQHTLLSLSRFHGRTTLNHASLCRSSGTASRDLRLRFIFYQLVQLVCFIHKNDLYLDSPCPSNIMVDDDLWVQIPIGATGVVVMTWRRKQDQTEVEDVNSFRIPRSVDQYESVTSRWIRGKISNLEYLMSLNEAAGRRMIDSLYHPMIPWVTDFAVDLLAVPGVFGGSPSSAVTVPIDGQSTHADDYGDSLCIGADYPDRSDMQRRKSFRDLSKTKFRLCKGDQQLSTTYSHSHPQHHVSESLGELTYLMYMARRTPLKTLRRVVRDFFVPEHYPASIERMYEWSPDECIPEFFTDPDVFRSIHKEHGLQDLELPAFASTPEEFVKYHRAVLELPEVSESLHLWIDLTFGHCLSGSAATVNMNVPLYRTDSTTLGSGKTPAASALKLSKYPGFVKLFHLPHPPRRSASKVESTALSSRNATLNSSSRSRRRTFGLADFMEFERLDSSAALTATSQSNDAKINPTAGRQKQAPHLRSTAPIDPETAFFRMASPSEVAAMPEGKAAVLAHQADVQEAIFVANFDRLLEPVYSIDVSPALSNVDNRDSTSSARACETFIDTSQKATRKDLRGNIVSSPLDMDAEFDNELAYLKRVMLEDLEMQKRSIASAAAAADDMFALGCILAELYLGVPILGVADAVELRKNPLAVAADTTRKIIFDRTRSLPVAVRKLIVSLLHPDPSMRPSAFDVLQGTSQHTESDDDVAPLERVKRSALSTDAANKTGFVEFDQFSAENESHEEPATVDDPNGFTAKSDFLTRVCGNIFPSYFRLVYHIVGRLKLGSSGTVRFVIVLESLSDIGKMSLEGLSLLLPHLLTVLRDPVPFRLCKGSQQLSQLQLSLLKRYADIVDTIGDRIGADACDRMVAPTVLDFLETLHCTQALTAILDSHLWAVLVLRVGPAHFFKNFLPQLLTYLVAGALHKAATSPRITAMGHTTTGTASQLNESVVEEIRLVQRMAVETLVDLVDVHALGKGLCARYVLPALLCLVGVPLLSITAYPSEQASVGVLQSSRSVIESHIQAVSMFDLGDTFVAQAIINICFRLGDVVTTEVVIPKILDFILPTLMRDKDSALPSDTLAALMDVLSLLNGILPALSIEAIVRTLMQPSRSSSFCIPRLLILVPYSAPWSVLDTPDDERLTNVDFYIRCRRNHGVFVEIAKLIVSSSMMVGPNVCIDLCLPFVEIFFENFVGTLGHAVPIDSETMHKAFELGSLLCLPLQQLVGEKVFKAAVPSLNPRLEARLRNASAGGDRNAPSLPDNIFPDMVVAANEPKKGMLDFLDVFSWKNTASLSSPTTAPAAPAATAMAINNSAHSASPVPLASRLQYQFATTEYTKILSPAVSLTTASTILAEQPSDMVNTTATKPHDKSAREDPPLLDTAAGANDADILQRLANIAFPPTSSLRFKDIITRGFSVRHRPDRAAAARERDGAARLSSLLTRQSSSEADAFDEAEETRETIYAELALLLAGQGRWVIAGEVKAAKKREASRLALQSRSSAFPFPSSPPSMRIATSGGSMTDDKTHGQLNNARIGSFRSASTESSSSDPNIALDASGASHHLSPGVEVMTPATNTADQRLPTAHKQQQQYSESAWVPAAHISAMSERVSLDVYAEANAPFSLALVTRSQWVADDLGGRIASMTVSDTESLLMTCSQSGVKIFSVLSQPLRRAASYKAHEAAPFMARFMMGGLRVASCDGSIRIWDVESQKTIAVLGAVDGRRTDRQSSFSPRGYSYIDVLPSRLGVTPSLDCCFGDEQILACNGYAISHFDVRLNTGPVSRSGKHSAAKAVSEWMLPPSSFSSVGPTSPWVPGTGTSASHNQSVSQGFPSFTFPSPIESVATAVGHVSCLTVLDNVIIAGSTTGGLWAVDRRMGRVLDAWRAHERGVLKVSPLGRDRFMSISENDAIVWQGLGSAQNSDLQSMDISGLLERAIPKASTVTARTAHPSSSTGPAGYQKVAVGSLPVTSSPLLPSNILVHQFKHSAGASASAGMESGGHGFSDAVHHVYCGRGHKLYSAQLVSSTSSADAFWGGAPSLTESGSSTTSSAPGNRGADSATHNGISALTFSTSHYLDRNKQKISKEQLRVSSLALLPLRRLILVGTDDGLVKMVS